MVVKVIEVKLVIALYQKYMSPGVLSFILFEKVHDFWVLLLY